MNESVKISPSNAFDAASLSTLRRIRGDTPAANDDACAYLPAIDDIVAWARRASGKNGLGHAMAAFPLTAPRQNARELHRNARFARSRAVAEFIATSLVSMSAAVQRALVNYRTYRDARETVSALRGLDDRTLHDLGYHRSEIESVAIEIHIAHARCTR